MSGEGGDSAVSAVQATNAISDGGDTAEAPADLRLERCPVCRRALGEDERACARCDSDLEHVRAALAGAWQDVLRARAALSTGDVALARAAAWRAVSLARTATTEALWERVAATDP